MSLDRHDLRAIAEHDQAVDRVKHFGSDNVCSAESDDSDSEDDSDSDGGDRREVVPAADRSGSYAPLPLVAILFSLAFLNPTTAFAQGVSESSSHPHPWLRIVCIAAMAFCFPRLTAVIADPEIEQLALKAVLDALASARISGKESAILLGLHESQWSEICRGQRHLPSFTRLLNLPWPFWQAFLPSLAYVITTKKLKDLVTDHRRLA